MDIFLTDNEIDCIWTSLEGLKLTEGYPVEMYATILRRAFAKEIATLVAQRIAEYNKRENT